MAEPTHFTALFVDLFKPKTFATSLISNYVQFDKKSLSLHPSSVTKRTCAFSLTLSTHFLYYLQEVERKEPKPVLESALDKLAETILNLDEASLASLWDKYKKKMENFDPTKDWEKSVIIFFIINSVRVKNHIFNENILNLQKKQNKPARTPKVKPNLKLIK
jgi:hypothetical protein